MWYTYIYADKTLMHIKINLMELKDKITTKHYQWVKKKVTHLLLFFKLFFITFYKLAFVW